MCTRNPKLGPAAASVTSSSAAEMLSAMLVALQLGDVTFDADEYIYNGESGQHSLTVIAAHDIIFTENDGIEFWGDGGVSLYTGPEGGIIADDKFAFTISTYSGDIIMEAGRGGIDVGMLQTGMFNMDYYTTNPGDIRLRTFNPGGISEGYDITTGTLLVYGYTDGSIDVSSAGNLTINGVYEYPYYYYIRSYAYDAALADSSATDNGSADLLAVLVLTEPYEGEEISSLACLTAKKDVTINGDVVAAALGHETRGYDTSETSTAGIRIGAGTNSHDGTVTVNGNITAGATTAVLEVPSPRNSEATIKVYAKNIVLNGDADPLAIADDAVVQTDTYGLDEQQNEPGEEEYYHFLAEVDIDNTKDGTCLDCENRLLPIAIDDSSTIESDETIVLLILTNDEDENGDQLDLAGGSVFSYTYTGDGILVTVESDGFIIAFEYTPPEDAVFTDMGDYDENGPYAVFTDTFEYYVQDVEGKVSTEPAIVTVTVKKYLTEPEPEPPIIPEEAGFSDVLRPPELPDVGPIQGDYISDLQWLAEELGLCQNDEPGEDENQCQEITQAYLANAFLHATDLRPYQAAVELRNLVAILHDSEGTRIAALTRVVNEFVSPDAPPNNEQMASIAGALSSHQNDGTHYASAGQWLDALVEYVGILQRDIGWSADESVAFVMGKYGSPITEAGDINVTAYVQMRLEGVSG